MEKVGVFIMRLGRFWDRVLTAPELMWRQTAGEPGNRIMLLMFLVGFAAGALYLVVSFFKASWREKLKALCTLLFCAVIILVIFWFALM